MDQDQPLFVFFRAQLKRLRIMKGWSQEALGKRIGFSGEMVSKVETGNNRPSPDFAAALDLAFAEMNGMFAELVDHAEGSRDVYPVWFRSWVDAEQRASVIRWWQPLLIPGLLQTEEYIRAVYEAWRVVDGNPKIDADVAARLDRQSILDRPTPPSFGAVIDESVLYREVGGPKVMHEQLTHLAEMSERPRITVQVLPADVGAHVGLLGAFAMAQFPGDTDTMVYMESPDRGSTSKDPDRVARLTVTYDALRDEALGARASRELLRKVAEERWTP